MALPVCIVIVFSAAVGRMGGAADNSEQQRVKNERALELARKSETEATDALANATAEAKKECNTGSGTGRGVKCEKAESRRDEAARRVDSARAAMLAVNNPKQDAWFARAAALSKGMMNEDDMRTYWPMVPPLAGSLAAGVLLAFGIHSGRRPASHPTPSPAQQASRWPRWPEPKTQQRAKSEEILEGQILAPKPAQKVATPITREPDDADADEPIRRSPFRRKTPDLKLVASNTNLAMGGILDFIIEGIESGNGERLSEKDVYKGYGKRCKEAGIKPVSIEEFIPLLDKACKECGIEREHKSGKVYLIDVRLVRPALEARA